MMNNKLRYKTKRLYQTNNQPSSYNGLYPFLALRLHQINAVQNKHNPTPTIVNLCVLDVLDICPQIVTI